MVWIDTRSECCFVENKIDMKRRLQARADANASLRPPGGPDTNADGSGGSQLDEGTMKDQGKVYRTDVYTIHWKAEGLCRPLQVRLLVDGAREWQGNCLPEEGKVTLSRSYLMEPPTYAPQGPATLAATLFVQDCAKQTARCRNQVDRP